MTEAEDELEFDRMERAADYAFRMHLRVDWMPLPARVRFDPPLTESELLRFSETNDVVWIEREADGAIYAKPIWDLLNGGRCGDVNGDLYVWAEADGRGTCYGSAGWLLPDGSMRGAPVSWVLHDRIEARSEAEGKGFARIAPDFIVEVMSAFDDRAYMRAKMEQWIANGVQVAWLIEGDEERVTIYRAGRDAEVVEGAEVICGDGVIAGFELKMARIWSGR